MSMSSETKSESLMNSKEIISPRGKPPEGGATSHPKIKTDSSRKDRRKEWMLKRLKQNSDAQRGNAQHENSQNTPAEQTSRLRNRQTIAKPDSLQYEPNLSRGFHAKVLHSLYNGPLKKKSKETAREKETRNKGKRKLDGATSGQQEQNDAAKKAKPNPTPPVQQQQPAEYFDSYTFSMNLINGEVDKVKAQQNQKGKESKNKYVLFIGNLPHDITREQLEEHFRKTGGIKQIRIPREKGSNDKGRGFAYMEFDGRISHGIALRLHQTTLGGRKINVEFTSIGGGKSKSRREKLRLKNINRRKMKRH